MIIRMAMVLPLLLAATVLTAADATTDFMSDKVFMEPLWHMQIDYVRTGRGQIEVAATGARFRIDGSRDTIRCFQRIPRVREVLRITLPSGALKDTHVTTRTAGGVIMESGGGVRLKIGCDSLLMLRSDRPMDAACQVMFNPAKMYSTGPNHLVMDPAGAVGVYPIDPVREPRANESAQKWLYPLDAPGMLWVSVGPPRPYEWEKSFNDRIIWHWSDVNAYPSDEQIEEWSAHGNILLMQSEVMAWRSWHVEFEPRSRAELRRVLYKCHALGMRAIVYTSPFYFVKGTPLENQAVAMAPNYQAGVLGHLHCNDGVNVDLFLAEIAKVVNQFGVDGLYFDGIYPASVKNTYKAMRKTRELLGDDRILEIHTTLGAPGGRCFVPACDTYADFTLKGEGQGFVSREWLRYFVSGYNISNAIGIVCNNAGYWVPTRQNIIDTLAANARLSFMPMGGQRGADHLKAMSEWYWPRLTDQLRASIEKANGGRQK